MIFKADIGKDVKETVKRHSLNLYNNTPDTGKAIYDYAEKNVKKLKENTPTVYVYKK